LICYTATRNLRNDLLFFMKQSMQQVCTERAEDLLHPGLFALFLLRDFSQGSNHPFEMLLEARNIDLEL
jgi:hypothetical protein